MLERVAINQVQFRVPGLGADPRGVALGKLGVLLFASIDQVVGFFRIYTAETALDDIYAQLRIVRVRTPLASREYLVLLPSQSSTALDRVARIARMLGGLCFTGTTKHFVLYRDDSAPLGYDADEVHQGDGDFVLYGQDFTQAYGKDRDIAFPQLLFRLSLQKLPQRGGLPADLDAGAGLYLRVSRGLAQVVASYLWRNRVRAQATHLPEGSRGAGSSPGAAAGRGSAPAADAGHGEGAFLFRVEGLPPRMVALFGAVPGIELYRPWTERAAVELGYRHPLTLESCTPAFERDHLYLFAGRRDTLEVIAGPPAFVEVGQLVRLGLEAHARLGAAEGARGAAEEGRLLVQQAIQPPLLRMELTLVPGASRRRVTALLVPIAQVPLLKRLVFGLPPSLLLSYQVAFSEELVVLLNPGGAEGIALGTLMQEFGPNLYVPLGHTLVPRIRPEVLAEQIGAREGYAYFFPLDLAPFALPLAGFRPLERRLLAGLEVPLWDANDPGWAQALLGGEVEVQMGEAGPFPLWSLPRRRRGAGEPAGDDEVEPDDTELGAAAAAQGALALELSDDADDDAPAAAAPPGDDDDDEHARAEAAIGPGLRRRQRAPERA